VKDSVFSVGKKRYWTGLASSMYFQGKKMKECLDAIHDDVIAIWNFYDPAMCLNQEEFKARILHDILDDLGDGRSDRKDKTALSAGIGTISGAAGIAGAVAGPAIPVAVPVAAIVAGGFVLAKWCYDVYHRTPEVIRRLMGYIIDLTAILEGLFVLLQAQGGSALARPVTPELAELAVQAYAPHRFPCHHDIKKFVKDTTIFDRVDKDLVLGEVISLINKHHFVPKSQFKQRAKKLVSTSDEPDQAES